MCAKPDSEKTNTRSSTRHTWEIKECTVQAKLVDADSIEDDENILFEKHPEYTYKYKDDTTPHDLFGNPLCEHDWTYAGMQPLVESVSDHICRKCGKEFRVYGNVQLPKFGKISL